ncbi:response regulator transcription factor [Tenacibaculum sp.]|nr:response regulator transcription factor [Tenacibaculum sp.]
MNIIIVEDEIFQLEDIKIALENLNHNCIGATDDPMEAIEIVSKLNPDVVLIDIHLQKRGAGISLARKINEFYKIPIIFVTSEYDETIIMEAVKTNPLAYLTKPVKEVDLKAALILAGRVTKNKINDEFSVVKELFARNGNKLYKINMDKILYVHTDSKNYCSIITLDSKKFSVRNSISGLLKILNSERFIQTHRSYLINWNFIKTFSESDQSIELKNYELSIPVGRTFKAGILNRLRII